MRNLRNNPLLMLSSACCLMFLPFSTALALEWADLWLTPDQQGQRLMAEKNFVSAASKFTQAEDIGAALFRAGEFEHAAAVLGRATSATAHYNRGNALIMLGDYAAAIDAYQNALSQRPDWAEARENLEIAKLRQARMAPPDDDFGGTDGQLGADEYVFDLESGKNKATGEETVETAGAESSEAEMRAIWLRKVETRPADFLAARFNYQLYLQNKTSETKADADE